jgi:hypothetical protein
MSLYCAVYEAYGANEKNNHVPRFRITECLRYAGAINRLSVASFFGSDTLGTRL